MGYPQGRVTTEEVAMPNEMPAITMAFVLQIWFLAVLIVVGAVAWRQAHPKDETGHSERGRR
jgi:urea transporter